MKKILLLTDFSENSRNAIEYAFSMFSYQNVDYILVNTYILPFSTAENLNLLIEERTRESKEGLEAEYEMLRDRLSRDYFSARLISMGGGLAFVVDQLCGDEDIDFIVAGAKGVTASKHSYFGSGISDLIRHSRRPIWVIPENVRFRPPERFALGSDNKKFDKPNILKPFIQLVKQYWVSGSVLFVVNIEQGSEADMDKINEREELKILLDDIPHNFQAVWDSDVVDGLERFVKDEKIDVLALIAREHSFFSRLVHQSVTRRLSVLLEIPVLVLHDDDTDMDEK